MGKIIFKESWNRNPLQVSGMLNISTSHIRTLREKYSKKESRDLTITEVGIETISRCNGVCSFCPVSVQNESRPLMRMSDETWKKIIDDLHDMSFSGTLFPYINNEILLDRKIFDRLEYVREKFGDKINISAESNGKLLVEKNDKGLKTLEKFASVADQLLINDYAATEEDYLYYNPRIRYLLENLHKVDAKRDMVLQVCHRLETQLLNDRFGMVDGHRNQKIPEQEVFCDFPFFQFNVNPKGDVFICCRDSYYLETIGNINDNTIMEIWQGKRYNEIRKAFLENKRICDVCKKCTSSGTLSI